MINTAERDIYTLTTSEKKRVAKMVLAGFRGAGLSTVPLSVIAFSKQLPMTTVCATIDSEFQNITYTPEQLYYIYDEVMR